MLLNKARPATSFHASLNDPFARTKETERSVRAELRIQQLLHNKLLVGPLIFLKIVSLLICGMLSILVTDNATTMLRVIAVDPSYSGTSEDKWYGVGTVGKELLLMCFFTAFIYYANPTYYLIPRHLRGTATTLAVACMLFSSIVSVTRHGFDMNIFGYSPLPGKDFNGIFVPDAPFMELHPAAASFEANYTILVAVVCIIMKSTNWAREFADRVAFSFSWNDNFHRFETYAKMPGPDDAYSRNFKVVEKLLEQHHARLHRKLQHPLEGSALEFIAEIGKGSNATVSLARYHNNIVAVKELDLSRSNLPDMIAFVSEMELMANLQHPNIIRFERLICDYPKLCMIIEYAKAGSLRSVLLKSPFLDWRGEKRRFAIGVAEGMQ
jgi:hypothetical protein